MHKVWAPILLELSDNQCTEIFNSELEKLVGGRWIKNDSIMEEQTTSHRFDVEVGRVGDPEFTVIEAAIRLKRALKAARK